MVSKNQNGCLMTECRKEESSGWRIASVELSPFEPNTEHLAYVVFEKLYSGSWSRQKLQKLECAFKTTPEMVKKLACFSGKAVTLLYESETLKVVDFN